MFSSVDLYLGCFLILCGFVLSLLNLRRTLLETGTIFSTVLLSENILLTCIGLTFVIRAIRNIQPFSAEIDGIDEMLERSVEMMYANHEEMECNFISILVSYGPLIVSLVNSFLSLIIDNYMHYRLIADVKKDEEENTVRDLQEDLRSYNGLKIKTLFLFVKKYFTHIVVSMQWLIPIIITLSMYPIDVKEGKLMMDDSRSINEACMSMVVAKTENCTLTNANYTINLNKYIPGNYFEMYEKEPNDTNEQFNSIVSNVYKIIANSQHDINYNKTNLQLFRKPKNLERCMKICYINNKYLILYAFAVAIVSYFVPITISTVILTRIHVMDVKKPNVKTYVSRELLYNILFWTPVMFDTLFSLTICSYAMNGTRTSIFNVIANVYQVVKNFMNTKYFKDNTIFPV